MISQVAMPTDWPFVLFDHICLEFMHCTVFFATIILPNISISNKF